MKLAFKTLRELAVSDIQRAHILKKNKIDFCCNGELTLIEACEKFGCDLEPIEIELSNIHKEDYLPSQNQDNWDIDFVCDYIQNTHHKFFKVNKSVLLDFIQNIINNHGKHHPELFDLKQSITFLFDLISTHIEEAESSLFPKIKSIFLQFQNGQQITSDTNNIHLIIDKFETEKKSIFQYMQDIRKYSNNFTEPDDACLAYTILYKKLKETNEDLVQMGHLLHNILFPKTKFLLTEIDEIKHCY